MKLLFRKASNLETPPFLSIFFLFSSRKWAERLKIDERKIIFAEKRKRGDVTNSFCEEASTSQKN